MERRAARWLATLPGLAEHALRVHFARSELYAPPPEAVARGLDQICRQAERSGEAARELVMAFVPLWVDPTHLEQLGLLRAAAEELELEALGRLLRASTREGHLPPARARSEEDSKQQAAQGTLTHPDGRPLTLGERRALARNPARSVIDKLMRDSHPMVVRLLLANPKITEQDVVRMAARRPAVPVVVCEIAKSWTRQGRVRRSIVLNPGAPPAVSLPLLALLSRPELRQVARAMDVPPLVRTTAAELAALRPPPRDPSTPDDAERVEELDDRPLEPEQIA
jgi:hypothetical protein